MPPIRFKAKLFSINSWTILVLPKSASAKLPSRGMVMVEGTINGSRFQAPLEPDGKGSHWLGLSKAMLKAAHAAVGDTVELSIEPSSEWPEPKVPVDLQKAFGSAPMAHDLWKNITPIARWDWIRWIGATKQAATHARRIEVALSKLKAGERRPCCFNRSACTVPDVSHNGVLLGPM